MTAAAVIRHCFSAAAAVDVLVDAAVDCFQCHRLACRIYLPQAWLPTAAMPKASARLCYLDLLPLYSRLLCVCIPNALLLFRDREAKKTRAPYCSNYRWLSRKK